MYLIVYKNKQNSTSKFICSETEYIKHHQDKEVFSYEDTLQEAKATLRIWKDDILEQNAE